MAKTHKNKNKSNKLFYSILIGLVIISVIAILNFTPKTTYDVKDYETYNKFAFQQTGKFWRTIIAKDGIPYEAIFYNHPLDLENVYFDEWARTLTLNRRHSDIVLAISPESDNKGVLAGINIARITGKFYKLPTSSALYIPVDEREGTNYTHPIIDCSEATEMRPVIYLLPEGNITGVSIHPEYENCIIISGENPDEIDKAADLYVFKIVRIME